MIKLPKWISKMFAHSYCPTESCATKLERRGVIAVGIREDVLPGNDTDGPKGVTLSFYYEYRCPYCDQRAVFSGYPSSIEDFIKDMMEIAGFVDPDDMPEVEKKSRISDAEFKEAKRIINNSKNFEELMGKMGISKEYINWFKYRPGENEEQSNQ